MNNQDKTDTGVKSLNGNEKMNPFIGATTSPD